MEMRSEVEVSMRRNAALMSPMALPERQRCDAEDCGTAFALIRKTRRASISHFQQSLSWGYYHAARVLDLLRTRGIVGARTGLRSYEILKVSEQET